MASLSESPALAEKCAQHGIAFVGPHPELARLMADKWAARKKMATLGVQVLPGARVDADDQESATAAIEEVGLPLIVKAIPTAVAE